jgi:hypothetical protein
MTSDSIENTMDNSLTIQRKGPSGCVKKRRKQETETGTGTGTGEIGVRIISSGQGKVQVSACLDLIPAWPRCTVDPDGADC